MIHCAEKLLKEEVAAIGEYAASRDDAVVSELMIEPTNTPWFQSRD